MRALPSAASLGFPFIGRAGQPFASQRSVLPVFFIPSHDVTVAAIAAPHNVQKK